MLKRRPEPVELMDERAQALAYANADFSEANNLFVDLFNALLDHPARGRLLDLGCGPADIPLALLQQHSGLEADALDGAEAMLEMARAHLSGKPELAGRIRLLCEQIPCPLLRAGVYSGVISNSLLHHLADPQAMWQTVSHCAAPGSSVLIMDLLRPASEETVDALVRTHAHDAPPVLKRDFRNSLCAAYTVDEVRTQLQQTALTHLRAEQVSDRHLAVSGRMPG